MISSNLRCGTMGVNLLEGGLDRRDSKCVLVEAHVALVQLRTRPMRGLGRLDAVAIAVDAGRARRIDVGATFAASLLAR
jgi:hypothetical protein